MDQKTNNSHAFAFDNEARFWKTAKEDVLFSIKETLSDYEECRLGLAGGSTPKQLYAMLAEEDLPWDKIKIIQVDERYLPSDNAASNLGMIRDALLKKISIPPVNIISFNTALVRISAAKEMHRKLTALKTERSPIFDLLILGAGEDGHIASLFSGDEALKSQDFASPAEAAGHGIIGHETSCHGPAGHGTSGHEIKERLTLTLPALSSAARAILLLKGEAKAEIFAAIQSHDVDKYEALRALLMQVPTKVLWCDSTD